MDCEYPIEQPEQKKHENRMKNYFEMKGGICNFQHHMRFVRGGFQFHTRPLGLPPASPSLVAFNSRPISVGLLQ